VDTTNNEIIAANVSDGVYSFVTVYSRISDGDVAPIRTIKPALRAPLGIDVDKGNNEIFVANAGNFISVFKRDANGDITPLRTIIGSSTGLDFPWGIAVDTINNEIIVVNNDVLYDFYSITVYDRTASGNAAPKRTISGASTGLNYPWGIAVDTVNNEIIVVNNNYFSAFYSISVYDRIASGNAAPKRTISGASTGLSSPFGIAIDTANNEIFVANDVLTNFDSITVYDRTASGNAAPKRTISGASTGLSSPFGIAIDTANNEIFVANDVLTNFDSITVYDRTASGNAAPKRTISGLSTGLYSPKSLVVDTANNVIIVVNNAGSITVYNRTASGNAAPLRTISGSSTGLDAPWGIALLP
jgi:DNA-binding beta-propeller fold protein YncE